MKATIEATKVKITECGDKKLLLQQSLKEYSKVDDIKNDIIGISEHVHLQFILSINSLLFDSALCSTHNFFMFIFQKQDLNWR